jgi:hypothetical protein
MLISYLYLSNFFVHVIVSLLFKFHSCERLRYKFTTEQECTVIAIILNHWMVQEQFLKGWSNISVDLLHIRHLVQESYNKYSSKPGPWVFIRHPIPTCYSGY